MHVPVILILDEYFAHTVSRYEVHREHTRKSMLAIAFLLALFFGGVPLFAWTPMTFEPSSLSCSVYQADPDFGYLTYMIATMVVYELVPMASVIFCYCSLKKSTAKKRISTRVITSTRLFKIFIFIDFL